jgi:chemotaxis protein MotB
MSERRHARRGKHNDDHEAEHDESERWLVSFADMMTLLFCLFMVLFSISSVNTSKFDQLQKSLQDAFSGKVLSGGKAIMQTGSQTEAQRTAATPPVTSLTPLNQIANSSTATDAQRAAQAAAALKEQNDFKQLKRRIDSLAKRAGLGGRVAVTIRRRGLVIQLLTDKVFFDSGQADIKPHALGLLNKIGAILNGEHAHPIVIEGYTDSQPIHSDRYQSNWQLSGDRAAAVLQKFEGDGVLSRRMSFQGFADTVPIATNSTPDGRAANRRVDVVLTRINSDPNTDTESTP